jgi:uncharacterized protein YukE
MSPCPSRTTSPADGDVADLSPLNFRLIHPCFRDVHDSLHKFTTSPTDLNPADMARFDRAFGRIPAQLDKFVTTIQEWEGTKSHKEDELKRLNEKAEQVIRALGKISKLLTAAGEDIKDQTVASKMKDLSPLLTSWLIHTARLCCVSVNNPSRIWRYNI